MNDMSVKPTVLDVAGQILARFGQAERNLLTASKLQKLLYYALGWSLALEERLLFSEPVEARHCGPAFASIHERYREKSALRADVHHPKRIQPNPVIDAVVNVYGPLKDEILVARTHREPPWQEHYDDSTAHERTIIPTDAVRAYFVGQVEKQDHAMHAEFIGAYIDYKYDIVSIKIPAISDEENEKIRARFGFDRPADSAQVDQSVAG